MGSKNLLADPRVTAFAQAVIRFCRIIERRRTTRKREFIDQCSRTIAELLAQLVPLYAIKLGRKVRDHAAEYEAERTSLEAWQKLFRSLATKLGKDNGYHKLYNPYRVEKDDPVYTCLSDDLAGIYGDLKQGLAPYRRGDELNVQTAVYIWRRNMHIHAADHCVSALRPLRRLLENYHDEDWF